jgi:hypothetical protein
MMKERPQRLLQRWQQISEDEMSGSWRVEWIEGEEVAILGGCLVPGKTRFGEFSIFR